MPVLYSCSISRHTKVDYVQSGEEQKSQLNQVGNQILEAQCHKYELVTGKIIIELYHQQSDNIQMKTNVHK